MKRYFSFFVGLLISVSSFAIQDIGDLLKELDKTVEHSEIYSIQKEKKINNLMGLLKKCHTDSLKYVLSGQLYDEYNSFKSDSAIKYAREELIIAEKTNDVRKLYDSHLDLAFILSVTGMFKESVELLQSIDKNAVLEMRLRYFDISNSIYAYMADNAVNQERSRYDKQIKAFRDSSMVLNAKSSSSYVFGESIKLSSHKHYDAALKLLLKHYSTLEMDKRKMANVAYVISSVYKKKGNHELEKYWLTVSSINDLQSANKEYISLQNLAYILYEEGDIDRAFNYVRRSADDALFCNARLRTLEVSQMLPLIDKAYQAQTKARQRQLIVFLVFISLLALLLLIARRSLRLANEKLNHLNEQLIAANRQLQETNQTLIESNLIKEEYIGRYMDQCSIYIDKMDNYRRLLNKIAKTGTMDDLVQTIKSKQVIDEELKEFYHSFDSTFLQLFPTFVREFSALLEDDEFVQLKPGQLLNTELRIYALMRLGIINGEKMSQFLRCSLSTIYNYRTKIRNRAIGSRDKFEENVLRIGKNIES